MCGLVAVFSKEGYKDSKYRKEWLSQALVADSFRGMDSTGIFSVSKDGEVDVYKKAMPGWDFIQMRPFSDRLFNMSTQHFFVGHNRAATKGSVTADNAHPFQHKHITGVHNGTLWGHKQLPGCSSFEVDSDALFYSMAVNGEEETIKQLDGAFALIWYNEEKEKLYMIRNDERPLCFATVKDSTTILVASEKGMLKWLAGRNGFALDTIYDLKPGSLMEIDKETLEWDITAIKLPEKKLIIQYPTHNRAPDLRLQELGYFYRQRVSFTVDEFEAYRKNNSYGAVVGTSLRSPYDEVRIEGVSKDKFKQWEAMNICTAPITGVRYVHKAPVLLLTQEVENNVKEKAVLCINCGGNIKAPNKALSVNDGHDLVCDECAEELTTSLAAGSKQ
jgi:glutamine phosphoribosylpyrophosphate amidotransferase